MSEYEKALYEALCRITGELERLGLEPDVIREICQEIENRVPLEVERELDLSK
jgi:hypothetical protein